MAKKILWIFVRSVLVTAICGFLSIFIEAIVFGAICGDLAGLTFAPEVHFGVIIGLTALLSIFGTSIAFLGFDPFLGHGAIWEEAARRKKSPKAYVMYIFLTIHLLLAIGAAVYVALTYPVAAEAYLGGTDSPLETVCIVAVIIPAQAIFYIVAMIYYSDSYFKCPRCKRLFTISSHIESIDSQENYQYKTETSNERVGALKFRDKEIAEVRADVTRGYHRKITNTSTEFKCACLYCGYRFGSVENDTKVGEWK